MRPHPHIGLSTVTYLFDGEITHRDSVGSEIADPPGRGQLDDRRARHHPFRALRRPAPRPAGDARHPGLGRPADGQEEIEPAFAHHGPEDLPTYEFGGLWARLIAGEAFGAKAKVKTHSPMFYVHWRLQPGARAQLPAEYPERAAFIAAGEVEVEGRACRAGQMLVFAPGEPVMFTGRDRRHRHAAGRRADRRAVHRVELRLLVKDRIEQAKADWRAGRFPLPPHDHDEFIPLPKD